MAKRNSSGRSGGRTRSAEPAKKSFGTRKPTSSKKSLPSRGKPFKKSSDEGSDSPYKRPRSNNSSFNKRSSETPFDRKEGGYKKSRSSDDKSSFRDDRSSGKARGNSSRSFEKKESGPYRKKNFSSPDERPYKKYDSGNPPTNKRDNVSGRDEKRFSSTASDGRPKRFTSSKPAERSKRPYKKSERNPDEKPPFKGERSNFKRPESSTSLRRERPYKKIEKDVSENEGSAKPKPDFKNEPRSNFKGKQRQDIEAPVQTGKIRLNKFISNSGVCSRREADELIKIGLISVNGKTITELGYKVDPGDEVRHESKVLHAEKPVYILLNKPKGFLTTTSDPQERKTVMHLLGHAVKERVYPVGRLDRNTTGLLLLTNDGELADKLMHPSYKAKKIYKVELDRPLTKGDAKLIMEGVKLEEGAAMVDDLVVLTEEKRTVGIEIHIGWNRVIRRIFESLNYEVMKLDRSVYAGLDKKDLGRGEWRFLTKEELVRLKHYK